MVGVAARQIGESRKACYQYPASPSMTRLTTNQGDHDTLCPSCATGWTSHGAVAGDRDMQVERHYYMSEDLTVDSPMAGSRGSPFTRSSCVRSLAIATAHPGITYNSSPSGSSVSGADSCPSVNPRLPAKIAKVGSLLK
jgi:hypothetical protein